MSLKEGSMSEAEKKESERMLFGLTVKVEKVPCVRESLQSVETRKKEEINYFLNILKW